MVLHVAGCTIMYADYAFGAGTRTWGTPEVEGPWEPGTAPMAEALDWLRRAHRSLMEHVETAMIGHNFYHAGEVNHLRSMLGNDDRWRWQQMEDRA
jgi:hypothetical protein